MLVCVVMSCPFLVAFWSTAGKGLTSWLSCLLCFVTFPNESCSTLGSPVLLLWIFMCGLVFVMPLCAPVYLYLVVTCWERSRLWCITVSLSLSHWCPGSGVVLDCIDS